MVTPIQHLNQPLHHVAHGSDCPHRLFQEPITVNKRAQDPRSYSLSMAPVGLQQQLHTVCHEIHLQPIENASFDALRIRLIEKMADGVEFRRVEAVFFVDLGEQFHCDNFPLPVGLLQQKQESFVQGQALENIERRFLIFHLFIAHNIAEVLPA